jgi:hypothetical protein
LQSAAADRFGEAIAASGSTFAADNDPELVRAAVPFGLKLMEGLLTENPRQEALLLACSRGFTQYAYAFVMQDAEAAEDGEISRVGELRGRGKRLFLRARDYGLRALEVRHPGITNLLRLDPSLAVRNLADREEVPALYWTAISWAGAIAAGKDNDLVADLPCVDALIDRAEALEPDHDRGGLHTFLITYEMNRVGRSGRPEERARRHFARAVELTGGRQAAPYLALAESVALANQDKPEFLQLVWQALWVDPELAPETRLANVLAQRRARWLLGRLDKLFID